MGPAPEILDLTNSWSTVDGLFAGVDFVDHLLTLVDACGRLLTLVDACRRFSTLVDAFGCHFILFPSCVDGS